MDGEDELGDLLLPDDDSDAWDINGILERMGEGPSPGGGLYSPSPSPPPPQHAGAEGGAAAPSPPLLSDQPAHDWAQDIPPLLSPPRKAAAPRKKPQRPKDKPPKQRVLRGPFLGLKHAVKGAAPGPGSAAPSTAALPVPGVGGVIPIPLTRNLLMKQMVALSTEPCISNIAVAESLRRSFGSSVQAVVQGHWIEIQ